MVHSLSYRLQYRPIRVGWCIRAGDFEALRESITRTFTMCGGAQNPLIVIDDYEAAKTLIRQAHVDLLLSVSDDSAITAFKEKFTYLPDWSEHRQFFRPGGTPACDFLDVVTLARGLSTEERNLDRGVFATFTRFSWTDKDPCADIFLTSCGRLPRNQESGAFVEQELMPLLPRMEITLLPTNPVPIDIVSASSLRALCHHGLEYDWRNSRENAPLGIFLGAVNDFWSIVNYWNFRASGWQLFFYDPTYQERMQEGRDSWIRSLQLPGAAAQLVGDRLAIVSSLASRDLVQPWMKGMAYYPYPAASLADIPIPLLYYPEHNVLANVGATQTGVSASMAIPAPPFHVDRKGNRSLALVTAPGIPVSGDDQITFEAPNVPCLNRYYGDKIAFVWNAVRAEPRGLALLQHYSSGTLSLKALNTGDLFREMFAKLGVVARPSPAGLVTTRVIAQMGGLDSCRPFRVRGLRALIENTTPFNSFTRNHAHLTIRDEQSDGSVGFSRYTDLHIEPYRGQRTLKPEDIFRYMVSHGAFRVGLELKCTECALSFWLSLDQASAKPACEYCGKEFDATPQLSDRDWRYRRSGVFGQQDSQHGAIPVALTLMRFLHSNPTAGIIYTPALQLRGKAGLEINCEIDFIALSPTRANGTVQVAIGECKTRKRIDDRDAKNLIAVADLLETLGLEVFIVFAKLEAFSPEELVRVRQANVRGRRRAIVLTDKELEGWFPYRWAESLPRSPRYMAAEFDEFADTTSLLYLRDV